MSITGPNVFVTVGDTDCLSLNHRHADIVVDSRVLGLRREYNNGSYRSVMGANLRAPVTGHGFYAEMLVVLESSADPFFGVNLSGNETALLTNYAGSDSSSVAFTLGGEIVRGGVAVQTGLTNAGTGDIIGQRLYNEAGTTKVQFYVNGAAAGTAVSITSGSYRLAVSTFNVGAAAFVRADRDDLRHLSSMPAGTQPWGASARIADAGGYSPVATKLSATIKHAGATLDTYSLTVTGSVAATWNEAYGEISRATLSKLLYVEGLIEGLTASSATIIGLRLASHATAPTVFMGDADGWCYLPSSDFGNAGNTYGNGGAAVATGTTCTTGDRPGYVWNPSTGRLWFTKNGSVIGGGNPEAGTGQHYTTTIAAMRPGTGVYANTGSRMRILTHAREQLYRPVYCEAWDGSDLMPEQHYKGLLGNDPYIEQGIWFPIPWGGDKSGSPVGAIEILNNDGDYDALSEYNLRNQRVAVDRLWAGETTPEAEARAIVSSVELIGEENLRVITDSAVSKLDVRVAFPTFLVGTAIVPLRTVNSTTLTYEIGQSEIGYINTLYDKGVPVTDWVRVRDEVAGTFSIRRTVAPAGKQVASISFHRNVATVAITNGDFSAWAADNPSSWTTTETAPNAIVTQSGNAARFVRTAGGAAIQISQATTIVNSSVFGFFKAAVSAWVSGTFDAGSLTDATFSTVTPTTTGTYYGHFSVTTGANTLYVAAQGGVTTPDFTLDSITFYEGEDLGAFSEALTYLVCDLGGFAVSSLIVGTPDTAAGDDTVGYYSNDRPTLRQAVSAILSGHLSDIVESADGLLYVARLQPPDQVLTTSANYYGAIVEADMRSLVDVEDDRAPALSNKLAHQHVFDVHSETDLAGSVTDAVRAQLTKPYQEATCATAFHSSFYSHGTNAAPVMRYSGGGTNYTGERLGECYDRRRRFYTLSVGASLVRRWRAGGFCKLTHSRFGLSAGKHMQIVSIQRNAKSPVVRLKLWG